MEPSYASNEQRLTLRPGITQTLTKQPHHFADYPRGVEAPWREP